MYGVPRAGRGASGEAEGNMTNPSLPTSGMTLEEERVMLDLLAAWNGFVALGSTSLDDREDFRRAIHEAQRILMSRVVARDYPEYWRATA